MSIPAIQQSELGTDIMCEEDLDPSFRLSSGVRNVGWALSWRLSTEKGGLFYDPNYGAGLMRMCHDEMNRHNLSVARAAIQSEAFKDERIQATNTSVRWVPETRTMSSSIVCNSAAGPFRLVANISGASLVVRMQQ